MRPICSSIRHSRRAVAILATLALLAGTAEAVTQTDVALLGRDGERSLSGGPAEIDTVAHAETYFGHFTIDDAVLDDDGQRLAAAVRTLAVQISGEHIAALPARVAGPGNLGGSKRGFTFVDGRLVRDPQDALGNGYIDVVGGDEDGSASGDRGWGAEITVMVAEPTTWSLVAIGLVALLGGHRRRLAS